MVYQQAMGGKEDGPDLTKEGVDFMKEVFEDSKPTEEDLEWMKESAEKAPEIAKEYLSNPAVIGSVLVGAAVGWPALKYLKGKLTFWDKSDDQDFGLLDAGRSVLGMCVVGYGIKNEKMLNEKLSSVMPDLEFGNLEEAFEKAMEGDFSGAIESVRYGSKVPEVKNLQKRFDNMPSELLADIADEPYDEKDGLWSDAKRGGRRVNKFIMESLGLDFSNPMWAMLSMDNSTKYADKETELMEYLNNEVSKKPKIDTGGKTISEVIVLVERRNERQEVMAPSQGSEGAS